MIKVSNFSHIPVIMKETDNWCLFYNDANGNLDKKPISPITKRGGIKSKDKLGSFEKVSTMVIEGKAAAIGFMLTPDSELICIDIDCHNSSLQDKYEERKDELLTRFTSYAETSISGLGTHIFIKGILPEGYKNKDNLGIIEVFNNRCIVVTGDIIEDRTSDILEEQESLEWLCETYLQKSNLQQLAVVPISKSTKADNEIIDKLSSSKKGKLLMSGNYDQVKQFDKISNQEIQRYPSKSEADLAFCNLLLYINGNDIEQATRIFLNSGMSKGLEKKSSGYLQTQMTYASATLQAIYDWSKDTDSIKVEEIEELDNEAKQRAFLERVAKEGFVISDNERINIFCTKYLLNYGYKPDHLVIDTSLLDFDSASNGRRFYVIMYNELIYNPTSNEWAKWDGKKWCRCYDNELLGASQKVFDNLKHEAFNIAIQSAYELDTEKKEKLEKQALELFQYASTSKSKRNCMEMIEFSKSHFNPLEYLQLETPINVLNLTNGIFDFDKMILIPHSRQYHQTMISNIFYDSKATCDLWLKTLKRILPEDEVRLYVQKAVGYTICSKFNEKAIFILFGDGNNGKTLFANILLKIMSEYSTILSPNSIMENMANSNNGPRPDLLKLRDKRFASISESNENDKLSEGVIKSLTGGGYVSCRTLHKEPVQFRATAKYWLDTNHKPTIRGNNAAIWNRLKVIPFTVSIPSSEIDTELGDKLETELSGILNWAIEGYKMYVKEGLVEPESIRLVVDQYSEDMNACDQWWKECIELKTDSIEIQKTSVNSKELYQSYKNWCSYNGEFSWSQRKFTMELNKKEACKLTKTVNGIIRYKLIKLNELGLLCYQKESLYSSDFNTKYNEAVNTAFRRQALIEEKIKDIEDRPAKVVNVIPMPHTDLLRFGQ